MKAMSRTSLQVLDIGFFIFHTVLVLFNLFGWAWKATRRWNLATLLLTSVSWFVLGIWYGIGYCICTDFHFRVRRELGYHDTSNGYIQFLIKTLTGADLDPGLVQTVTAICFVVTLTISIFLNVRDWRRTHSQQTS